MMDRSSIQKKNKNDPKKLQEKGKFDQEMER